MTGMRVEEKERLIMYGRLYRARERLLDGKPHDEDKQLAIDRDLVKVLEWLETGLKE